LFAQLGRWSLRGLVVVRVDDTAVGCAAALAASLVVRPHAAAERLRAELRAAWAGCRELVADPCAASAAAGLGQAEALGARRRASAYESLLRRGRRRREAALVRATEALCHSALELARVLRAATPRRARERSFPAPLEEAIADARARVVAALSALDAPRGSP